MLAGLEDDADEARVQAAAEDDFSSVGWRAAEAAEKVVGYAQTLLSDPDDPTGLSAANASLAFCKLHDWLADAVSDDIDQATLRRAIRKAVACPRYLDPAPPTRPPASLRTVLASQGHQSPAANT